MIFVGDAHRWQTPSVFDLRIQSDVIAFQRQAREKALHRQRAIELFVQCLLVLGSPPRRAGRQCTKRETNGRGVTTSVDPSATIKASLEVGVIEILNGARSRYTLVFVQRMLENSMDAGAAPRYKVLTHDAVRIRQTVWEKARLGHQQQARRTEAVGGHDDCLGLLKDLLLIRVKIHGSRYPPAFVDRNFPDIGIRAKFAV